MIIVGELINASRKPIAQAIRAEDETSIHQIASAQVQAGTDFVDVNAGVFEDREPELLSWLVRNVQRATGAACSIDSPSLRAIEAALEVHQGAALINSISLEKRLCDGVSSLLAGSPHHVIALCMGDDGVPESVDARLANADRLVSHLAAQGVAPDHIYLDPLVQAVSTRETAALEFLEAVAAIRERFPEVHCICGMSNVSFGLPQRRILNQAFAVMAVARGLDAAILNPLDSRLLAGVLAAETLAGKDPWCERFLDAHRSGRLTD